MNAALTHITNTSERLIRLSKPQPPRAGVEAILDMGLLRQSVLAIARKLVPRTTTPEGTQLSPLWDEQAEQLLRDRELVLAITNISLRPISVTYLYLKAFTLWNATAHSEEEVARHCHFALALIFIALDIVKYYHQGKVALEELAYSTLTTDMALREALPLLNDIHDTALQNY